MLSTDAPPEQARLAELAADRAEWVTGRRDAVPDPGTAISTAVVLLHSLRLADLVHGAREFAAELDPDEAAAWRRSWTRTRFLFGNPANLTAWNPPRIVAPGGSAAWLGPFPDTRRPGLIRLLKPVMGGLPNLAGEIDLPGGAQPVGAARPDSATRRVLYVGVAGLTLVDYLVHLHHTLAEAVLLGRLRLDEPLRLRHRPVLGADLTCGRPAYARVLPEPDGTLRLHTWLTPA